MKSNAQRICTMALLIPTLSTRACVEPDGANDKNYVNLATNYSSSLAYVDIFDPTTGYASYCSGIFLNGNWVLTAAHPVTDPNGNQIHNSDGVAQGCTLSSSSTLNPILSIYIYPEFDNSGNTPDLMLIKIATPVNAPTQTIGSASPGDTVTSAGFGEFGTPSTGLQDNDGNARAWQAPVWLNSIYFSSTYYQTTEFGAPGFSELSGQAAPGDSGAPVFNLAGQLVGITEARSIGLEDDGTTTYNMISQTNEYAWIMNTITPVQPVILSLTANGADTQLMWQGKGGSNYVVQAASALGGTNIFTDITGVIALRGVGPVETNFVDPGVLTNQTTRFYRIRTN